MEPTSFPTMPVRFSNLATHLTAPTLYKGRDTRAGSWSHTQPGGSCRDRRYQHQAKVLGGREPLTASLRSQRPGVFRAFQGGFKAEGSVGH